VRRASLADQTEQILSDRIVNGDLEPGDQLPTEHDVASESGGQSGHRASGRMIAIDKARPRPSLDKGTTVPHHAA